MSWEKLQDREDGTQRRCGWSHCREHSEARQSCGVDAMREIAEVLFLSRVHATEWENEGTPWHLQEGGPNRFSTVFRCGTVHVVSTRREGLLPSAVLCHSRKDLPVSDEELKKLPSFQTTQPQVSSDGNKNQANAGLLLEEATAMPWGT